MASFARQAGLLKSLGHPTRLRILRLLEEGEACVCHLGAALHVSQPAVSQHLMALRRAGAVSRRRDGKNVYYRLSRSEILGLLDLAGTMSGGTVAPARPRAAEDCPCPRCQAAPNPEKVSRGEPAPSSGSARNGELST